MIKRLFIISLFVSVLATNISWATKHYQPQGEVFALRGLTGLFSSGLHHIATEAQRQYGMPEHTLLQSQYRQVINHFIREKQQHRLQRPIILIGHSFGADNEIRVAYALQRAKIPVDLLVTLDAVTPRPIPSNVKRAVNFYEPHFLDFIPVLRGIPVRAENPAFTRVENYNVHSAKLPFASHMINHITIDKVPGIQQMVLHKIGSVRSIHV